MRNLKRALSLTLASVMLLGMMVFGTSAVGYSDADSIDNVEAAEVLNAVKVMQGNNGKFSPNQTVTRGQMAIIVIKMLYGDKVNVSQFAGASEFTDVPANAYYTGYVNMASSLGIISGYGDGRFGPGAPVNTAQAAAMLCRALGYFKNPAENANGWALASITRATGLGMFGDMTLNTYDPLSRDDVAEMVFNAMTKTVPVDYNETWNLYYTRNTNMLNGVDTIEDKEVGKKGTAYERSLGYEIFKLAKSDDSETYGRPGAYTWNIDGKVATSVFSATADKVGEYTAKMTYGNLYTTLGKTVVDNIKKFELYVDGTAKAKYNGTTWTSGSVDLTKITRNSDTKFGYDDGATTYVADDTYPTGNGVKTEVYVQNSTGTGNEGKYDVTVVVINTYKDKVAADYDAKNERLSLDTNGTVKSEDVAGLENFKEGDIVLVTKSEGAVKSVKLAEKITDQEVSSYTKGSDVKFGSKTYKYNATTANEVKNIEFDVKNGGSYDFYLDENGYIVFAEGTAGSSSYIYLTAKQDTAGNNVTGNYVINEAVLTDGTKQNINIKKFRAYGASSYSDAVTVTDGTPDVTSGLDHSAWYTYNVDSDGYYELTKVEHLVDLTSGEYKAGTPRLAAGAIANSSTVFVIYNSDTKTYTTYTGISAIPTLRNASGKAVANDKDFATYVYLSAAASDISSNSERELAYFLKVADGDISKGYDGTAKKDTFTFKVISGGDEKATLTLDSSGKTTVQAGGAGLYYWENTSDGYPSGLVKVSTDDRYDVKGFVNATVTFSDKTLKVGDTGAWTIKNNDEIFKIKADGSAEKTTLSNLVSDYRTDKFTGTVTLVSASTSDSTKIAVYFQEGSAEQAVENPAGDDVNAGTQEEAAAVEIPVPEENVGTIKVEGTVVPGVASEDQDTMGDQTADPENGKDNFVIVKFKLPTSVNVEHVAIKQTNDALAQYYSEDPSVEGNVKFKTYDFSDESESVEFYIMVLVSKTATLEVDVNYDAAAGFNPTYHWVIDGSDLDVDAG